MKAINPHGTWEYICLDDRELPEEEQTKWPINHLNVVQQDRIADNQSINEIDGTSRVTMGRALTLALHMGLNQPINFPDENGKDVILERDEKAGKLPGGVKPWKIESLDRIPKEVRKELALVILKDGELEIDEAKNS